MFVILCILILCKCGTDHKYRYNQYTYTFSILYIFPLQVLDSVSNLQQLCQRLQQTHLVKGMGGMRGPSARRFVGLWEAVVYLMEHSVHISLFIAVRSMNWLHNWNYSMTHLKAYVRSTYASALGLIIYMLYMLYMKHGSQYSPKGHSPSCKGLCNPYSTWLPGLGTTISYLQVSIFSCENACQCGM